MNTTLYYDIVKWLRTKEMRSDIDEWTKLFLSTSTRQFEVQGTILLRKKEGLLLPVIKDRQKAEIIKLGHDHPLAGHMGQKNTYYKLQHEVWWPGMQHDITRYVQQCDICQKRARSKE